MLPAMEHDSMAVRSLVVRAAETAALLIADPAVRDRWSMPSALAGLDVGALAAHLVRATGATLAYLDRGTGEGPLLDAVGYFDHAITSPIHERIREVSASEASAGHAEVDAKARSVAAELALRLPAEPHDRTIGALHQRRISLDDFCRTRLIEILMHVDDLAASVGVETPWVDVAATGHIIDVLIGIGRARHGDWAVIRALGRAERSVPGTFPVL